jgi:signal transduction histidine kinase
MAVRAQILVVDDEPRGVELLARTLRALGDVVGAANGEEAWTRFQATPFDLVVSDQRMPGLSGVELLGRIADHDDRVGRILLTGFADFDATVDAINRGRVHAYLSKPCPPAHLLAAARSVLERGELARQNRTLVDALRTRNQELELALASLCQAKDAAEAGNRAKSQFLANMSHELRTPLTAILGFGEQLEEGLDREPAAEAIRAIRQNGAQLLRVVSDLLDFARMEAGELSLESAPVRIDDLLAELRAALESGARERGLELRLERDAAAPAVITTDAERLRQVLLHLLSNALRFTERGDVRVHVRRASLGAQEAVEFAVSDTGIGISAEDRLRIFQPFTQVDGSYRRRSGGAGLGLSLSTRLVDLLGGSLAIESEIGRGSTFRIALPVGRAQAAPPPAPAPVAAPPASLAGTWILLAEDCHDNQRLIASFLRRGGAAVEVVGNGRLAVDRVIEAERDGEPFDLVLMDMQMPELDGCEATRALRERGCRLPIVALTAHALPAHREECLSAGCDDYLTKPVERAQLIQAVARHAHKHAASGGG